MVASHFKLTVSTVGLVTPPVALVDCCTSDSLSFTKDVNVFCTEREFPNLPGLSGFLQVSCSLLSLSLLSLSLSDSSRNSLLAFFVMPSENSEEYPCLLCLRFLFEVESPRDLCYLSVVRSHERKSKP